jgi:hypothetical protein
LFRAVVFLLGQVWDLKEEFDAKKLEPENLALLAL